MDKYLELKEKFEANRDDENAVKMAAYMRNLFSFYGLSTNVNNLVVVRHQREYMAMNQ